MEHVLDNPAWSALISGNKHLSYGNEFVKYFDKEVSPFVGFKENSLNDFQVLYEMLPHNRLVGFITPQQINIPGKWQVIQNIKTFQMLQSKHISAITIQKPVSLTHQHVPQMLALTQLTRPGPFASMTINMGHYQGIFENDRLVAMAGQRLHAFEYAEISAVCTHADHTGKGYARQLLIHQINRIKAASGIPFLHVRCDNERAVKVYEDLGFSTRKEIYFYILQKN